MIVLPPASEMRLGYLKMVTKPHQTLINEIAELHYYEVGKEYTKNQQVTFVDKIG